jgi:chromate transporter
VIILLVTALLTRVLKNKYVQAVLRGLKPCVVGIVLATGISLILGNCVSLEGGIVFQLKNILLTAVLLAILYGPQALGKKKISPILLIVLSAVFGILLY